MSETPSEMSATHDASRLLVRIGEEPIDLAALHVQVADPASGAVLEFVGVVRESTEGKPVVGIEYEAYVPMAERILERIGAQLLARWPVRRAALVHRTGWLVVGELSLAILLSTPHRAAGFEALRFAIETLKHDAPVWKREHFEDGAVWVPEGS